MFSGRDQQQGVDLRVSTLSLVHEPIAMLWARLGACRGWGSLALRVSVSVLNLGRHFRTAFLKEAGFASHSFTKGGSFKNQLLTSA